jgi:conjugative relaxase-like TrwC/TraI family protein
MPKSASVLAYVAGDERLLAPMQAVRQTMGWVEKDFAEGRTYVDNPKGDPVRTGHLTYALFQHDTSRKLDPQAHIHVVVANLTKVAGNWQALFNDELWKNNSLIGSVYHAALRTLVEDLGYQTRQTGKHGQFEIEGVPKAVLTAFSQRREDVLAKAAEVGITTPQGRDALVIRTRDAKVNLEDRDGLRAEWGPGGGAGV